MRWFGRVQRRDGRYIVVERCSIRSYQAGGKEDIRHAESWYERRRCRGKGEMEEDDSLW